MTNRVLNRLIISILIIATIVGIRLALYRIYTESQHRQVQLSMTKDDLLRLVGLSGEEPDDFLQKLKKTTSLTSIIIDETTLESLANEGRITIFDGKNSSLLALYPLKGTPKLRPHRTYIYTSTPEYNTKIINRLNNPSHTIATTVIPNTLIECTAQWDDIKAIGLEFDPIDIQTWQNRGWSIIYRTKQSNSPSHIYALTSQLIDPQSIVICDGETMLGYPQNTAIAVSELKNKKIRYTNIEFTNQKGISDYTTFYLDGLIKLHSIPEKDIPNYTPELATHRFIRAVVERQAKILVIHPFWEIKTDTLDTTTRYIQKISTQLKQKGYTISQIKPHTWTMIVAPTGLDLLMLGLATICAIYLIWSVMCDASSKELRLWALIALLAMLWLWLPRLAYQHLMAWLSACSFPILAIVFTHHKLSKKSVLTQLFSTITITIMGTLITSGILCSPEWLSGAQQIRGIKLLLLLPLLLIGLYIWITPQRMRHTTHVFTRTLTKPLQTKTILIAVAIAIGLAIYIWRSGNTGLVSNTESNIRLWLETTFSIRPRSKELIGFILLPIGLYYYEKKIGKISLWLGSIALISITNTFCHTHINFTTSIERSFLSIAIGCTIGAIALFLSNKGVPKWIQKRFRNVKTH